MSVMEIPICVSQEGHKEDKSGHRIFCWNCRRILRIKIYRKGRKRIDYLIHRDGNRCTYCEVIFTPSIRVTVDHVIPKSRGGSDRLSNKVLACHECNQRKGNKSAEEFRKELVRMGKVKLV